MSQAFIRIIKGNYRGMDVAGKEFALVKQWQPGTKGGFVTVQNGGSFPGYPDRKSTRLNSSHMSESRMPSSA